ncbi:MAG: LysM peptidoglycan-binding domain-containing protein [Cephaloticoccus sp.]|nr:LysM peptidoglycan-binding domain-containing protein [Cephaloticoccus sp.]MCF7760369.1 LysM peptidoglycan-binding domain-containing protein [Cephaloticoccus sp.]
MTLLLIFGISTVRAKSEGDLLEIQAQAYQSDANAQNILGNAYTNGEMGLKIDFAEAFKWYARAAELNSPQALFNVGLAYDLGRGVTVDAEIAFKYYLRAAEKGYATAQFNVGNMYASGRGVAQDSFEAVLWYRQAAQQKLAQAQFNLGLAYETGNGVAKDEALAAQWYRSAAEQDFPLAQYNLGILLEDGRGVEKDEIGAAKLYRSAADHGVAPAQNNYGLMLYEGRGNLTSDPVEAFVWLNLAVENGITPTARDMVAKELSADQIFAAKRLLEQLHSTHVPPTSSELKSTDTSQAGQANSTNQQREVENLRDKNSQLERWVKSLEQALQEEPKTNSTPILERFGLEPRTNSRNDELQKEISRLRQELIDARQLAVENTSILQKLRTENDRLQHTHDQETDSTTLRNELLQSQYVAAGLAKDKARLELDVGDLTSRLKVREAELATQSETANQAELRRLESERNGRQKFAALEAKLRTTELELAQSQLSLASIQKDHATRDREIIALSAHHQKKMGALSTRLAQALSELDQFKNVRQTTPVMAVRAEPHPRSPKFHIVEQGDSLSKISERYYGTRGHWEEIYRANSKVLHENNFLRIGQILILPDLN